MNEQLIPNITLVYQLIVFLLLALFLTKALFEPMLKVFDAREKAHQEPERRAQELAAEAREAREKYETIFKNAQATAESVRQTLMKDAQETQRQTMDEARRRAEETASAARAQINEARERLAVELPRQADRLAARLADKLLGRG